MTTQTSNSSDYENEVNALKRYVLVNFKPTWTYDEYERICDHVYLLEDVLYNMKQRHERDLAREEAKPFPNLTIILQYRKALEQDEENLDVILGISCDLHNMYSEYYMRK